MRKLLLVAALGVAGMGSMTAQTIQSNGCDLLGCSYTYTSTCGTTTNFTSLGGEMTLNESLIMANIYNTRDCGSSVRSVTYLAPHDGGN